MKYLLKFLLIPLMALALMVSCNKDEDILLPVEDAETGILKLDLSLIIEQSAARVKVVNTDDFIVKIYRVVGGGPDELVVEYPRFADIPEEIELITGTYYVEAQNIDPPAPAAFEQPWYYGVSDPFNIDKEDLIFITVQCTLANYKVSFHYSSNVPDNFTTWNSKATRAISGEFLEWAQGDDREGYFLVGDPVEELSIEVHLEYQKVFEPGVIARDFYATIPVPSPATLYQVNIDAVLQDGVISIGIDVDEGFDVIDINPVPEMTLWNKLGSADEVVNSEIGPDGTIVGTVNFNNDVMFDKGATPKGRGDGNGIDFPTTVVDPEKGTVEMWAEFYGPPVAYSHGVYGFVNTGHWTHNVVAFYWHNVDSKIDMTLQFNGTIRGATFTGFSPPLDEPVHLAFVWDRNGIAGTGDYMRIYVDGVVVATNTTQNDWGTDNTSGNFRVAAPWDTSYATDRYSVDNVKVWNSAKTYFSDRFFE